MASTLYVTRYKSCAPFWAAQTHRRTPWLGGRWQRRFLACACTWSHRSHQRLPPLLLMCLAVNRCPLQDAPRPSRTCATLQMPKAFGLLRQTHSGQRLASFGQRLRSSVQAALKRAQRRRRSTRKTKARRIERRNAKKRRGLQSWTIGSAGGRNPSHDPFAK